MLESLMGMLYLQPLHGGRRGAGLLLTRVLVGAAFLVHGYGKVADLAGFAAEFHMPMAAAVFAAYAQLIAGGLLILGLATPLAALTITGTMTVATLSLIARGEPWINPHGHSFEASFFYLVTSLCIALLGPGSYSLDSAWVSTAARDLATSEQH